MRGFAKWTLRIFLGLLLVLVALYAVRVIVGYRSWSEARSAAEQAASAALAIRAEVVAERDASRSALVSLGDPARSWSELVCVFDSVDAGWIVQYYTQDCWVNAVDVYAVGDRDAEQVALLLGVGREYPTMESGLCQRILSQDLDVAWTRVPPPKSQYCADAVPVGSHVEETTSADISSPGAHVVVRTHGEATSVDIGCSPWGIVFCGRPWDDPVVPQE